MAGGVSTFGTAMMASRNPESASRASNAIIGTSLLAVAGALTFWVSYIEFARAESRERFEAGQDQIIQLMINQQRIENYLTTTNSTYLNTDY